MNDPKETLLLRWQEAKKKAEEAKQAIEKELTLRKEVMEAFFPEASEGVNTFQLEQGWTLKASYKLDRKVDEASLPAIREQLRAINVNPDQLLVMKPTLALKPYRALAAALPNAARIFEQALIIKPATPVVDLVPPKEKN